MEEGKCENENLSLFEKTPLLMFSKLKIKCFCRRLRFAVNEKTPVLNVTIVSSIPTPGMQLYSKTNSTT